MKKWLIGCLLFIGVCVIVAVTRFTYPVKLADSLSIEEQVGDFILRVFVEEGEKEIVVKQSLQYLGDNEVEITHQTPLVFVALEKNTQYYTGSFVKKRLKKGDIYYQDDLILNLENRGEQELYIRADFYQQGEEVNVERIEKLNFE